MRKIFMVVLIAFACCGGCSKGNSVNGVDAGSSNVDSKLKEFVRFYSGDTAKDAYRDVSGGCILDKSFFSINTQDIKSVNTVDNFGQKIHYVKVKVSYTVNKLPSETLNRWMALKITEDGFGKKVVSLGESTECFAIVNSNGVEIKALCEKNVTDREKLIE